MLLAQLSDSHIGADWGVGDPVAGLVAAVHAVRSVRPDAVLVTGDLVDNATDAEYERVRELLEPLGVPTYVLPGNHDDRAAIRRHFELPGAGADPVQYSADFGGELRLVVLDSLAPGEDSGSLDRERLGWLDSELAVGTGRADTDRDAPPPGAHRSCAVGRDRPAGRRSRSAAAW